MTQLWSSAQSELFGDSFLISSAVYFALIVIFRELFLAQSAQKPIIYYIFLFPGIIIHELSHVVICLITFTKINSIKLFSKTGGFVVHQRPKFLAIGFLISIAPLATGLTIIYFSTRFWGIDFGSISSYVTARTIVILYFLSSILITMMPSKQDVLNAFSVYFALSVGLVCYYFLSQNQPIFAKISMLLAFCLAVLSGLNLSIFMVNRLWKSR